MKKINFNIDELHKVQLSILIELDRVCKKYNIEYFIAYGTLLGAIRHNGFIPWDDDMDVLMSYTNFIKLQNVPKNEWQKEIFLQSSNTDPEYNKCYIKLRKSDTTLIIDDLQEKNVNHGVAIDVYPLIHLTDSKINRMKQYLQIALYMLFQENHVPKNHGKILAFGARIILLITPERNKKIFKEKLLKLITVYETMTTKYCCVLSGNMKTIKGKLNLKDFSSSEKHKFEHLEFPIPIGYKNYLKIRYGDYMKLPPEEMQGIKLEHVIKVDLSSPYTIYKGKYYCVNK